MADFKKLSSRSVLEHCFMEQGDKKIKEIQSLNSSPVQILGKIKNFIFTTNSAIWFEKNLNEELANYQPKLPVEIDFSSTSETIDWLKSQNESWVVHPKEIAIALKYKHFWPSVRTNKKIIGCLKIGFENVYIVDYNRVIEFPEKMAYIYDTYVLPEHRGKGVGKYLVTQVLKFLKAHGYCKVGLHIPPWNKASLSVFEKLGFKKVCYIRCFRIFGILIRIGNPATNSSILKGGKILQEDIPYG